MFAVLFAAVALVAPSPSPMPGYAQPTPPPEPNHVTIDALQNVIQTSGNGWQNPYGVISQLAGRYEFQVSPKTRFANSIHWERLSSHWTSAHGHTWQFDYDEYDDEFDLEVGRPEIPTGVGVGYFEYNPIYDSGNLYNLRGFGVGVDHWPNYYVPHAYYYSVWYYPYVRGSDTDNGVYGIVRADLGYNIRFSLVSPWNVRVGFQDESWFAKNAYATDTGFTGPYVGVSYWH